MDDIGTEDFGVASSDYGIDRAFGMAITSFFEIGIFLDGKGSGLLMAWVFVERGVCGTVRSYWPKHCVWVCRPVNLYVNISIRLVWLPLILKPVVWKTYGDCPNYLSLTGHKGPVLDLQWSRDSAIIFSASTDAMLASWDVENGQRIRRYVGHEDIVNALDVTRRGPELIVSASDDGTIGVCLSFLYFQPSPL
jgi:hypothetical protein